MVTALVQMHYSSNAFGKSEVKGGDRREIKFSICSCRTWLRYSKTCLTEFHLTVLTN